MAKNWIKNGRLVKAEMHLAHDTAELGARAAIDFARLARAKVQANGVFRVVLSGGSTPKALFDALVLPPLVHEIPWDNLEFFFGDERYVAHSDASSNCGMAREYLFQKIPVAPAGVYPIPTDGKNAKADAARYEQTLKQVCRSDMPQFDLVYLGLGPDGHTASLFPGTDIVKDMVAGTFSQKQLVAATFVEKLDADRISLTPALINQAETIIFLVAGEEKAPKLRQMLDGPYDPLDCPVQLIKPEHGKIEIYVDGLSAGAID